MLRRSIKAASSQFKAPLTLGATRAVSAAPTGEHKRVLEPAAVNGTVSGRPLSPDLAIWRFSNTAYLHVGVRITGGMLGAGFIAGGLYGLHSCDIPAALDSIKLAAPIMVPILKGAVAFPLSYHMLGGYRAIYHDLTAKGIDAEFQDKSSIAIVAISGAITLIAMFTTLD